MNLPQKKVDGLNMVIDMAVCLTTKEFERYSDIGTFRATGETWKLNGEMKSVHAWFSVDQLQAHGETVRLGFGRYGTKENKENGIFYKMEIKEEGEGRSVKGTISYSVVGIEIKGVKYRIKKDALAPDNTPIMASHTANYVGKSQKNSTIFQFFRKILKEGLLEFEKVGKHLEKIPEAKPRTRKKANVEVKQTRQTRKTAEKKEA